MKNTLMAGVVLFSSVASAGTMIEARQLGAMLGKTQASFQREHGQPKQCTAQSGGAFCVYETASGRLRIVYFEGRAVSVVWDVPEKQQRAMDWSDLLPPDACPSAPRQSSPSTLDWDCAGKMRLSLSNDSRGMTWLISMSYPDIIAKVSK